MARGPFGNILCPFNPDGIECDWYDAGYRDGYYSRGYGPALPNVTALNAYRRGYQEGGDDAAVGFPPPR